MLMPNDDPQILAAVRRYVIPDRRYGKLHGWNIKNMEAGRREGFGESIAKAASQISNEELVHLLKADWRARLTASWLIGVTVRSEFRELFGALLEERDVCEAAKGYCFALSMFGAHRDSELLAAYLGRSLDEGASVCAQYWALGALLRNDVALKADYANPFLVEGGVWERWSGSSVIPSEKSLLDYLCEFAQSHARPVSEHLRGDVMEPVREYESWCSRPLPGLWGIMGSENERKRRDSALSAAIGAGHPLFGADALAVAECEQRNETLFSVLGYSRWAVVNHGVFDHGAKVPECHLFENFGLAEEYMAQHPR
jgi:hypothetical protein